jgi:hypothetical protein
MLWGGGGRRGQSTGDEQRLVGAARRWWSRLDHRRWAGPDRWLPEMEEERETRRREMSE